jgi:beta-lactamase regulating signal transducer with metallopeptidase domain
MPAGRGGGLNVQAIINRILTTVSGNPLLERLLVASLELIVVTGVVLAIIHIARVRSNRVIALMWLVALSKPVLGLALGAPAPVFDFERPEVANNPVHITELVPARVPQAAQTWGGERVLTAGVAAAATRDPARPDISTILLGLWLTGAGLLGVMSVLDRLRIRNIIKGSRPPGREIEQLYLEAAGHGQARRLPALRVTDKLESPAIAGSFRPVIFLPAWMTKNPDRDRIVWSLRHELTHWRHRDTLAGFVREISQTLFYFHPLVWWAGRKWKEASEVACDQALVGTRSDARRYAEQLYQILTRVHTRRQIMITSGLFATRTQIGKRIELLLKTRPLGPKVRTLPAAVFLVVFAALVLALGAEISPQADPHDIYVKAGDKDRTVSATITETGEDGNQTITLTTKGKIRFNKKKTDVASISDGGRFELKSVSDGESRELIVTADDDGNLDRVYKFNDKKVPFDDEGREWLADILTHMADDHDGDYVMISKPHVKVVKPLHVESAPRVKVMVVEPDHVEGAARLKVVGEDRRVVAISGDEHAETIDVYISGDADDDANIWTFKADGDVLTGDDGHFLLKLSPGGKVIIKVDRDGDTHQLEIRPGNRGERNYTYKVNGEEKPYNGEAKKLFEDYLELLDDGLEVPKGEKI